MKISLTLLMFTFSFFINAQEPAMNESEKYIYDAIKESVWRGFDSPADVQQMVSDILEDDADEKMLRNAVLTEFSKKKEAEKSWPKTTDVDKLRIAFSKLKKRGILCLHNAGVTNSDGHDDANDALKSTPKNTYFGYCFYHRQAINTAVAGKGLMIAFDHVKGDVPDKIKVGLYIQEELEKLGLKTHWNKKPNKKINIPKINWQNRAINHQ